MKYAYSMRKDFICKLNPFKEATYLMVSGKLRGGESARVDRTTYQLIKREGALGQKVLTNCANTVPTIKEIFLSASFRPHAPVLGGHHHAGASPDDSAQSSAWLGKDQPKKPHSHAKLHELVAGRSTAHPPPGVCKPKQVNVLHLLPQELDSLPSSLRQKVGIEGWAQSRKWLRPADCMPEDARTPSAP